MTRETVRIGCASAFWGDSTAGAEQLVRRGEIDFLVFDYLAEITMSLLARARARKPELGYVPDFVEAIAPLLPEIKQKGIRIVSNAGGINPQAAATALRRKAEEVGIMLNIAVVTGDDLTSRADEIRAAGVTEMFSGAVMPEKLTTMNAYLGAQPIALALDRGADVVITGRCVDSAVVLGPMVHTFGWSWTDYDKLAQGSLAGHLLECAAQVTGGLFTDWRDVPGWDDMGMPIAVCSSDGSFVVTKPPGTGGLVVPLSVCEQMLYEIGDPAAYILPDVVCDFRDVSMTVSGPDQVRVTGARGRPPTPTLKVSATWHDGYRVIGTLTIGGYEAAAKAERAGEAILARVRRLLSARGIPYFSETSIEVLGSESMYGPWRHSAAKDNREVVLKIGARHRDQEALEMLAREIFPPGSSMAQGITGFFAGRPGVQPVLRLFSFLWPKEKMPQVVHFGGADINVPFAPSQPLLPSAAVPAAPKAVGVADATLPLIALAVGRSGDKGNSANIGLIARKPDYLPWIRAALMEEVVRDWFAHLGVSKVERFELPGMNAFNFLLHDALGGGGVASLRVDSQGKAYAQMLMDYPILVPSALANSLKDAQRAPQPA
ncbi:MAG TPA: acyclic terpene utilization AtuA family protein [Xanthobacteraceae bacterium]|nr:acyclic terpene utilization AtuA family protein [Xanthobacteraceae bacterium]